MLPTRLKNSLVRLPQNIFVSTNVVRIILLETDRFHSVAKNEHSYFDCVSGAPSGKVMRRWRGSLRA